MAWNPEKELKEKIDDKKKEAEAAAESKKSELDAKLDKHFDQIQEAVDKMMGEKETTPFIPNAADKMDASEIEAAAKQMTTYGDSVEDIVPETPLIVPDAQANIGAADTEFVSDVSKNAQEHLDNSEE